MEAIHDQLTAAAEAPVRVGPTYYQTHAPSQVSNDQHSTLIAVTMPGDEIDKADKKIAPIVDVVEATNGPRRVPGAGDRAGHAGARFHEAV